MLEKIVKFLKTESSPSAELRAAIEQLGTEQATAHERLEAARERRRATLLAGGDKDRTAVRSQVMAAEDELEALDVAHAALKKKLDETEEHEQLATVNAKLDRAEEQRSKMVERIRTEYAPAVDTIVSVLLELEVTEQTIAQANEVARQARVDRAIDSVVRSFPSEAGFTRNPARDVTLVSPEDFTRKIWPPDAESSAKYGEVVKRLRAAS